MCAAKVNLREPGGHERWLARNRGKKLFTGEGAVRTVVLPTFFLRKEQQIYLLAVGQPVRAHRHVQTGEQQNNPGEQGMKGCKQAFAPFW